MGAAGRSRHLHGSCGWPTSAGGKAAAALRRPLASPAVSHACRLPSPTPFASRDLPPEVRPIIEDNRMMSEELRRYRSRLGELEGALAAADRTATALRDELARERQRLKQCAGVSPEQLLQEQAFRQALAERYAALGCASELVGCFAGRRAEERARPA